MVRAASVTNSDGERSFAGLLRDLIAREPYFQSHPDALSTPAIEGDPFGRSNVLAVVRGEGSSTVVLTGHYDVVSAANYGPLERFAFDPEMLTVKLIDDLRANGRSDAELLALADLESGDFVPGRGVLDMKSGLAAGLVALYRFSQREDRVGNLVFLAVADEEVQSHGARGAVAQLAALGLDVDAVINLDSSGDDGDGSDGRALYLGSVGKLLVSAYVVGIDTHAGYPLAGINPNFLLSEIAVRLECNPELADRRHGETAPPPTSLQQTDLKSHYDVTTPGRAWALYNVLTHGKPAQQVIEEFRVEVQAALDQSLVTLCERAAAWGAQSSAHAVTPYVLSFGELCDAVRKRSGGQFDVDLGEFVGSLDPKLSAPDTARAVTDFVWAQSQLVGPCVVLGFGALHYPAVLLEGQRLIARLRDTLERAREELGVTVKQRMFFAGISDMSWFGHADASDVAFVNLNTPSPRARIHRAPLGKPTVNLGPWGRDYHQRLERVHAEYSFEQLPELVLRVADTLLEHSRIARQMSQSAT